MRNFLPVHRRAKARIQILYEPLSAFKTQLGMTPRNHRVLRAVKTDLALYGVAPDAHNAFAKRSLGLLLSARGNFG